MKKIDKSVALSFIAGFLEGGGQSAQIGLGTIAIAAAVSPRLRASISSSIGKRIALGYLGAMTIAGLAAPAVKEAAEEALFNELAEWAKASKDGSEESGI